MRIKRLSTWMESCLSRVLIPSILMKRDITAAAMLGVLDINRLVEAVMVDVVLRMVASAKPASPSMPPKRPLTLARELFLGLRRTMTVSVVQCVILVGSLRTGLLLLSSITEC